METASLYFIFTAIFFIAIIAITINGWKIFKRFDMNKIRNHLILVTIASISYIGALITGILWIVQYLKT